ncbi:MAG: dihydropteroate synthase [Campylobacteraceae bacterium 4484_4]|nr:MAG: dihydropteroate synthase [Campylobacteraceae bacterium 4484_4]
MKIVRLSDSTDAVRILKQIGSTREGNEIMKAKMRLHFLYLRDIRTPAANILKQDALSIGAELAVERDTILCKDEHIDALLIATTKQLRILAKKELAQPFGLKALAKEITGILRHLPPKHQDVTLMGVLNANEDSFYSGSRFVGEAAIRRIETMIEEGAGIIDIGAVSSRPGSKPVPEEEELKRVRPIVDAIYEEKLYEKVRFSLDSYAPLPIQYALDRGFGMINDITALSNESVAKLASRFRVPVVLMHMQGTPQTMQQNPRYEDLFGEVEAFFKERIKRAEDFGIEELILDPGIGFGKTLEHNLKLLHHLGHFAKLGYPLLVGASRKSMIDAIVPTPTEERLPGTLAIHLAAIEEGASIIRCHDVREHRQAIKVNQAIKGALI